MAYRDVVLADGPVSYWRLGEASGTNAVDEQAANAGTYTGATTLGVAGALAGDANTAVTLDGSSGYVTAPDSLGLRLVAPLTLEAWVKPTDRSGYFMIVTKSSVNAGDYEWRLDITNGTPHFLISADSAGVLATTAPTVGVWSHLVLTYDAANVRFYLNGLLDGTPQAMTLGVSTSSQPLNIGKRFDGNFFKGGVDEVAVYNYALTPAQVLAHYTAGTTFSGSDTVTVSDTPVVKGGAQPKPSESITVSDTPVLKGGAQPVVSESLTVSEAAVVKGGAQPKPSEALTVTDSPVVQGPAQPKPSEAVALTETAVPEVVSFVSTSQSVTVTDAPAVFLPTLVEAASEALTVTDTPVVQGPSQPVASQAVTVSEAVAAQLPYLVVAASQAVTLTETVASQVQVTASVSETVTVTDTPVLKGGAQPQASEALTVSETVAARLQYRTVAVSESVTVTDTPAVQLPGSAALSITASETLSVTETLTPILPYLLVSAADTLHATDTPAVQALIRIAQSEQITVSTTVRFPINYIDAQSGTLTFTGTATSSIGPDLNVTWKRQHLYYVDYRNWVRGP